MNYLQGLLKTVLKDDELHYAQNELIISEALERLPGDVQTDEIKKLRERFTVFKSQELTEEELLKMLSSSDEIIIKKVEKVVENITEDQVYNWKEKGENSAYKMRQLTMDMLQSSKVFVEFLDTIKTYNQTFDFETRKRFGYVHNQKIEESALDG